MKLELSTAGILLTVIGLILAILGMLSFTGLVSTGVPAGVMFTGYPITIAGLILIYSDLRANKDLVEAIEVPKTEESKAGEEATGEDPLFLTDFKKDSESESDGTRD